MVDIGGIIKRLAPLIEKPVKEEYNLWVNSKTEAQNLSSNLKEIQNVLEEAERRRLTDPRVKAWLQRLQDATYEIDDALDEWETTTHQLQIQELGGDDDGVADVLHTWLTKISIFINSLCLCFQHIRRHRGIALNIKELNAKIELIAKETGKYSSLLPIHNDSLDIKCEITTSFSQLVVLEGQENEKEKIVDQLMTCQELKGDIQVISLVGMTGIGKTTLAQLAFHDPRVESSFELRSWVCLSHTSDEVHVTKAILQSLRVNYPEHADLQTLLELIQAFISGKKLLLVLDNVWIENDSFWRQLKGSLIYGKALESIILVTSRNENVAKSMGSTQVIQVVFLSHSDSWSLFEELAFRGRGKKEREILEGIGQRIAEKCEGLPLAVKTLGCYLYSRYNKKLWEDVLEKELWQLEEVAKALFSTFKFSYNELPLVVKQCFSYCAIFPKDVYIEVNELIRLWMSQGYLISSDGADDDMELKGMDCFEKLATRSFFQEVKKDDKEGYFKSCTMHSIVQDFAQYLIKVAGSKVEEVRSLYSTDDDHELSPNQLSSFSKSVRVLHFRSTKKDKVPSVIGELIHLRYLDLRGNPIKKLPVTICGLYNLHTLDLRDCCQISELPKQIHRLRNLRHLLLHGTDSLERVPKGVGKLTALRTLDEFKVGKGRSKLRYLADLNQLRGMIRLYIGELYEEEDVYDARKAQLSDKTYITSLMLVFDEGFVGMDVLEALQPPPNLQLLYLSGFEGIQCPSWFNNTCLNNLTGLHISSCNNLFQLPPLGTLPFLEEISFWKLRSLVRVGVEFLGITRGNNIPSLFPKLRNLGFYDCNSWQDWEDIEYEQGSNNTADLISIMLRLQNLYIFRCASLKGLPRFLPRNINLVTNHGNLRLPSIGSS